MGCCKRIGAPPSPTLWRQHHLVFRIGLGLGRVEPPGAALAIGPEPGGVVLVRLEIPLAHAANEQRLDLVGVAKLGWGEPNLTQPLLRASRQIPTRRPEGLPTLVNPWQPRQQPLGQDAGTRLAQSRVLNQ